MFMTETAKQADVVFPAAPLTKKTARSPNTSGEIQPLHKAAEVMGARSDSTCSASFRINSKSRRRQSIPLQARPTFTKNSQAVPGYDVAIAGLLAGMAEPEQIAVQKNGHADYDVPVGLIRPAQDSLFTSGTLGRYMQAIESVPEAKAKS